MGVRRRLLRELLASLKYIKNLTEQQIKASLWRGEATLQNLELEPRELQKLFFDTIPCSIELLEVTVDELCIRIPWSKIMTQSAVVVAGNVQVRAVVHCEDEISWREVVAKLQRNFLASQLQRIENAPFTILSGPTGAFDQIRQRMTDGMQIQVNRVSFSLLSCHVRHFPMHTPAETSHRPLAEALRVVGEDIMLSPCDSVRNPTDKLKAMAVYIADKRHLQLSKFMKCRAFRVAPGRCPNPCPHAAADFMENPVVMTCHICQKYPSDGYRICPFLVGNALSWEFSSTLGITVCECQLRAVFALVMDVSRLEEWRMNKDLLKEKPSDIQSEKRFASEEGSSAASTTEPSLEATALDPDVCDVIRELETAGEVPSSSAMGSSAAELPEIAGSADVAEPAKAVQAAPDEKDANADDESGAASDESDDMCSCDGWESPTSRKVSSANFHTDDPPEVRGLTEIAATDLPLERVVSGSSAESQAQNASENQESEMQAERTAEPLVNTSSFARTLARGSDSPSNQRRRADEKSHLSLSSAASMLGLVREISPQTNSPPVGPEADPPLMDTTSVARVFAKGPADRPETKPRQEPVARSTSSTQSVLHHGAKLWKKVVPLQKVIGASLHAKASALGYGNSSRDGSTGGRDGMLQMLACPGTGLSAISGDHFTDDPCEGLGSGEADDEHSADGAEIVEDGDEEEASGGEEELEFYEAEDYFSVASSESGAALEDSASGRSRWLKPVLKWFGTSKSMDACTEDWPEMTQVVKAMSVAVTYLTVRLAVVEPSATGSSVAGSHASVAESGNSTAACSASSGDVSGTAANADIAEPAAVDLVKSGDLELCLDSLFWHSEVRVGLPAAQLECIQRLARPAEDQRGLVSQVATKAAPAVGPWCLPVLQQGAQTMNWPLASLNFRGPEGVVELLQSCDAERQVGADAMLVFNWQPRDAPPVTVTSSSWVLQTWPMEISFHRAIIIADAQHWTLAKRCHERVKPFLVSKFPSPTLLPPQEPQDSGQLFPTESLFMEFLDCQIVEPRQERTIIDERRWPLHVTVPHVRFRSNSSIWDFGQLLAQRRPQLFEEEESRLRSAQKVDTAAGDSADGDVTIPKEMFDQLVHRAADATLQRSQVKAAREELQAAYIKLAATKATYATNAPSATAAAAATAAASAAAMQSALGAALGGALGFGNSEPERMPGVAEQVPSADSSELERLRRKCMQLESSLQSQGLAQRRLEAELENYKTLARDELRQVICAKTHAPYDTLHSSAAAICSAHA